MVDFRGMELKVGDNVAVYYPPFKKLTEVCVYKLTPRGAKVLNPHSIGRLLVLPQYLYNSVDERMYQTTTKEIVNYVVNNQPPSERVNMLIELFESGKLCCGTRSLHEWVDRVVNFYSSGKMIKVD